MRRNNAVWQTSYSLSVHGKKAGREAGTAPFLDPGNCGITSS